MKWKIAAIMISAAVVLLCLAAWAPGIDGGNPRNPSLFEKRFQASQIAAFFPVDPDLARKWVPPAWNLALDAQGKATGVLALLYSPEYCLIHTPNSPPLKEGENVAPDSVVHFWFLVQGPAEVLPVPGAQVTSPTAYYYDVADLVTGPVARQVYRRAGRPAFLVSDITLVDQGKTQTAEVVFPDGAKITINAYTPTQFPVPLNFGGNVWQWHVGGLEEMGDDFGIRLDPASGNPSNVNITRGQYLALLPGPPNTTQVIIHADPGTGFADCFGMNDVVASRATFFRLNNVLLNGSRGDLLWTTYPPDPIPLPPAFPY